jgi:hypothetical protein
MVMCATKRAHSLGSLSTRHLQRRTPDSCCNITEDEQFLALRASSGFGTVRFRCKNAKIGYELVSPYGFFPEGRNIRYKVPEDLQVIDALPRNALSKVDRKMLETMIRAR